MKTIDLLYKEDFEKIVEYYGMREQLKYFQSEVFELNEAILAKQELEKLKNRTSLGRIGSTRDVAETVLFLASEKSNFITGQTICVDGGLII